MIRTGTAILLAATLLGGAAAAQDAPPVRPEAALAEPVQARMAARRGGDADTVTSSISIERPLKEGADIDAEQQAALGAFYRMAAQSCRLVLDTVAESCALDHVNSNAATRDRAGSRVLTVSGQIRLRVTFKTAQP